MKNDRQYILRTRPTGSKRDKYIPIKIFDITEYRCGLKSGDMIRLKRDLPIFDENDMQTDCNKAGEIWSVIEGSSQDPTALWLRQANGELHAWDDDPSIFEQFELIKK